MPLYEYMCGSCGHRFERIRKFSDPPVTDCPKCGQPVQKLISSPAIQFKGTGWYITDYAKSGSAEKGGKPGSEGKSGDGDKPAAKDTAGSAESTASTPAETKPAAPAKPGGSDSKS